jgi:fimbrial chaperone protein
MKLLILLVALPWLLAFKFSPMSQAIRPAEGDQHALFWIENDTNEKMALEISVKKRIMDETGKEELPETDEITVLPPQLIVPAKDKRSVRVSWKGKKDIDQERAFRVIAEQLPLKLDQQSKKKSGIQMLMKYMAALYVTPKDAQSQITVSSYSQSRGKLKIIIKNEGKAHRLLIDPTLIFQKGDQKISLKADELKGLTGENVLAQCQRIFEVNYQKPLPENAKVTIKIND